ncbi:MAG: amidohydrolase family protein [Paludibacteraceae bacterium]|nr:amidohydrolase family protein [Paludibacteraceae bacterium]
MKRYFILAAAVLTMAACTTKTNENQTENPADKVLLSDFRPQNVNNIPATKVEKAKFPIIDMHSHDYASNDAEIQAWIKVMDQVGVRHTAVMHCAWIGRPFEEVAAAYAPYKDRFRLWCCFDYTNIDTPEGLAASLKTLERYHEMGAVGIGELGDKGFGDLYARPVEGMGIHIDDPRVKPLLEKCAELKMPVSIHIGEPIWMYLPMDETNDGLPNGAVWHVDTTDVNCLGYDGLIRTFENAVRENPKTLFIACHYLNMNHDYVRLGAMLDKYPNMYVDIAARVAEAAQTPRATREFILKYQDRIIFGTDNGMSADMYQNIFRVLETNDEHFYIPEYNYHWYLSGFNLPDEVLQKIYYKNAERILGEYK